MIQKEKRCVFRDIKINPMLICLILAVLSTLLFQFSQERYALVMEHYATPALFVFLGITVFSQGLKKRAEVWAGMLLMGWYVLSRILMGELYLQNGFDTFGSIFTGVCLAMPFFVYDKHKPETTLRIVSALIALVVGCTAWLGIFGISIGSLIKLPILGSTFGRDPWEKRLSANLNPNPSAALFLTAALLLIWSMLQYRSRRTRIPAVLCLAGLYAGMALCVCRTVMIQFALVAAGLVFLLGLRLPCRSSRLKTAAGRCDAVCCLQEL